MKINLLKNILVPTAFYTITIRDYLDMVRGAKYEKEILAFRNSSQDSRDVRDSIKRKIPAVTISGTFTTKVANANLATHSGFICVDFDHIADPEKLKRLLVADKYTYAVLYSASGNGLAALVKIDGDKHLESYNGLKEYYFRNFGELIDKSCSNVSRFRYLSMDRDLFVNDKSSTFKEYPKVFKQPKAVSTVLTGNEFDELLSKIISGGHDLTNGDYKNYLTIGFALSHEFKESGRQYFHSICAQNAKYDSDKCDKQYSYCLRDSGNKKVRIGSLYHLCKEAGIELKSASARKLETIAKLAKRDGRKREDVTAIAQTAGLDVQAATDIADKIFDNNVDLAISGESNVGIVRSFLQSYYQLRYNIITCEIEDRNVSINGKYKVITDMELNTMYMRFSDITEGKISKDFFTTFIFSEFTTFYDPFLEFFDIHKDVPRSPDLITTLARTIKTDTPEVEKWLKHWVCGIIASIYGQHSTLVWVMAGEKINTGKTEWFRRLLPTTLKSYYAESKLEGSKDDDILMCRKILIMDDELSGKSKQESKKFKELTSKQTFTIRPPYGRVARDMNRIAVLCATTNDLNILNDPSGNRRFLPINVLDVDKEAYNKIDKNALFMAFYDLYHSGFEWRLSAEDIQLLSEGSDNFQATNFEAELIDSYFEHPSSPTDVSAEWLTNTQIKAHIETISKQKIFNVNKLGAELKNLGFEQQRKTIGRFYFLKKKTAMPNQPESQNPYATSKDIPF